MRSGYLFGCFLLLLVGELHAALPPGTVVIYSNGDVERLLSRGDGVTVWEDARKRRITRSDNPLMPILERTNFLAAGGYTQQLTGGAPGRVLNAPVGTREEFTVRRVKQNGETLARNWQCERRGQRSTEVLGRTRAVQDFLCERFIVHRKLHNKQIRERLALSYSPELGLVVAQERTRVPRTYTPEPKVYRRHLVAVLSPAEASYAAIRKHLRTAEADD